MKIGEKKQWYKGKWSISMERIKFDWKALVGWLVFIGVIVWFFWLR